MTTKIEPGRFKAKDIKPGTVYLVIANGANARFTPGYQSIYVSTPEDGIVTKNTVPPIGSQTHKVGVLYQFNPVPGLKPHWHFTRTSDEPVWLRAHAIYREVCPLSEWETELPKQALLDISTDEENEKRAQEQAEFVANLEANKAIASQFIDFGFAPQASNLHIKFSRDEATELLRIVKQYAP